MDTYTSETKEVLEKGFNRAVDNIYVAHQPIYGFRTPYASTSHISRYIIIKSILNVLNKYTFSNFIDIGGAEGFTAHLVKTLFNVKVHSTDLSENACKMAKSIFGIEATACDIHNLPFSENEFDVVLCSETLEHVTNYQGAIDELVRITKNLLIITVPHETPEMVAETIRNKVPHGHITYFDVNTLDYLKAKYHSVEYVKTLSPHLIVPRVVVEAYKKPDTKFHFKLYNALMPVFRKIFGIGTANRIVDLDAKLIKKFGAYEGITFIIEKTKCNKTNTKKKIKARDFTGITVPEYHLKGF